MRVLDGGIWLFWVPSGLSSLSAESLLGPGVSLAEPVEWLLGRSGSSLCPGGWEVPPAGCGWSQFALRGEGSTSATLWVSSGGMTGTIWLTRARFISSSDVICLRASTSCASNTLTCWLRPVRAFEASDSCDLILSHSRSIKLFCASCLFKSLIVASLEVSWLFSSMMLADSRECTSFFCASCMTVTICCSMLLNKARTVLTGTQSLVSTSSGVRCEWPDIAAINVLSLADSTLVALAYWGWDCWTLGLSDWDSDWESSSRMLPLLTDYDWDIALLTDRLSAWDSAWDSRSRMLPLLTCWGWDCWTLGMSDWDSDWESSSRMLPLLTDCDWDSRMLPLLWVILDEDSSILGDVMLSFSSWDSGMVVLLR